MRKRAYCKIITRFLGIVLLIGNLSILPVTGTGIELPDAGISSQADEKEDEIRIEDAASQDTSDANAELETGSQDVSQDNMNNEAAKVKDTSEDDGQDSEALTGQADAPEHSKEDENSALSNAEGDALSGDELQTERSSSVLSEENDNVPIGDGTEEQADTSADGRMEISVETDNAGKDKDITQASEDHNEEFFIEGKEQEFSSTEEDDPETLLKSYIDKKIQDSLPEKSVVPATDSPVLRKSPSKKLTGINATVYAFLKEQVQRVAAGESESTIFEMPVDALGLEQTSWTADELGVDAVVAGGQIADDAADIVYGKVDYNLSSIMNYLLVELPFDLYWYDKTEGVSSRGLSIGAKWDAEKQEYVLSLKGSISFFFSVADDYALGEYCVVPSTGETIRAAVAKAQEIVSRYRNVADHEKLAGYRDEICRLASYNYAATDSGASYGNPWQLIWVFDADTETKVVCEGYSKAFQYLCDLTKFDRNVSCSTVTGPMSGGTGSGGHMWNVVTMEDGRNYLVDMTNCDTGTIGYPDQLFLKGYTSGSLKTGYGFICGNGEITYMYDDETRLTYEISELTLADSDYVYRENIDPVITSQPKDRTAEVGDSVSFSIVADGYGLTYQWQYRIPGEKDWNKCGLSGAKTPTVTVPVTAGRGGYLYRCLVTDRNDITVESDPAMLTVNLPLAITKHPAAITSEPGKNVIFSVTAIGTGLTYQWQYLPAGANTVWNKCGLAGAKTATVTVPVTESRAGVSYRCVVTDQSGKTLNSNAAKLNVTVPLSITRHPVTVTSQIGKTVSFSVSANGTGLKYQWQYRLPGKTDWNKCGLAGAKTDIVTVPVTAGRVGQGYRCVVSDGNGKSMESNMALLLVDAPLTITKQPVSAAAKVGDTITFHLKADGNGLSYQWQYQLSGKMEWNKCGLAGAKTDTVTVPVTSGRIGYSYRCIVTDAGGKSLESNAATLTLATSHLPDDLNDYQELSYTEGKNGIREVSFRYGTSVRGRELIGWSVAPPSYARTILLNFEIHGWEDDYAADGQLLVNLGNAVISHYLDAANLYGTRLIVIPSCNPDGLAEGTTNDGFGRCNADGVDLNRDFDIAYQSYTTARNYTPHAFAGKESAALRDLVQATAPAIAIDFHGWENCTIGNSDVAEVFSLFCGLNHKREFTTDAHGYFAYWAESKGAEGLLVEFKSPSDLNHSKVFDALDKLIASEYGTESSEETDATVQSFCPIITYANSSGKVYTQQATGNTGTSYGYIDGAEDRCEIIQIYKNGWCKVRYPVSGYTKTGYCELNHFIEERLKVSPYQATVVSNATVYTTSDALKKLGSVWTTDTFTVIAESEDMVQIIYPLDTGGYKMGWINKLAIKD